MSERESINPTYDSRETGARYHVSSRVDDRPVMVMEPVDDPFVRHTVHLGWWDLLRGLLRRRLSVTVIVGGDRDIVEDVLELDNNYLGQGDTSRRREFNTGLNRDMFGPLAARVDREIGDGFVETGLIIQAADNEGATPGAGGGDDAS